MKSLILLLSIVSLFSCKTLQQEALPKTKVFFLAGQSNMDGRARAYNLSNEDKIRLNKAQRNVTLYYNFSEGKPLDTTKVAKHTAKKFGANYLFGPELFFGIEMSEKYPNHKIVLIKRAKGGMSLYGAWNVNWSEEKAAVMNEAKQPKLYSEFVSYAHKVLSKLEKNSYELCGMLWVQGETDSGKRFGSKPSDTYETNLTKLIQSVRTEFSTPQLPFLIFQVGNGKVVSAMKTIAKTDKYVVLIPQVNKKNSKFYFEKNPNPIGHYTCKSMIKIGTYFFEYYEKEFASKIISFKKNLFRKDNLIPWSIVGFDVKERTPKQRLEMLERLGYKQYAYGYRPKHIPTMKQEWKLAKEKGMEVKAVWLYINLNKDKVDSLKPESEVVFKNLKESGLKTQIWVGFQPTYFDNLTDKESLKQSIAMISYLSEKAKKLGCKIALYNHGGWYGKPENQLKIIKALPKQDLGVVFNFHHAHDSLDTYSENIKTLFPYLWSVSLNGMKPEGPKIITIGEGSLEKSMIQELINLKYKGPFNILGHVKGGDPELILEDNFKGLQTLF